jgi:hypothetical protein
VNIWRDPEAAATVRLLRSGFETVPTVTTPAGELVVSTTSAIKAASRPHRPGHPTSTDDTDDTAGRSADG